MCIEVDAASGMNDHMMPVSSCASPIRRFLELGIIAIALLALGRGEAADPPPVPDPLGLGERLALIDYLQATYGIHPPPGETVEDLRQRYVTAWSKAQAPVPDDVADQNERIRRLRQRISDRFHQDAEPTLDESALVDLLHRLESEQQDKDDAAIAARAAKDAVRPATPTPTPASGSPIAHLAAATPSPLTNTASTGQLMRPQTAQMRISFPADGVSDCTYWHDAKHDLLIVTFGTDHNGAFTNLDTMTWQSFCQATEVHRAVALFGHGNGTGIASQSIDAHLKKYKDFYESLGGQLPPHQLECLLFASCSEQNANQMTAMRDGLGYYPTWKVAAGARTYMNGPVFLAAVQAVINRPAASTFRGIFRYGQTGDDVASIGEVGEDGERGQLTYWRVLKSASGFTTTEQP
jgi:hypothetical protein